MFYIIRILFLSSIVAFLINIQQNFACPQIILEDTNNNSTSSQYIINENIPPEIDFQIVNYLTDPQDLKTFSEVSQAHRNYIENYVDKYLENCIDNKKNKHKQKDEIQVIDIKKFLRALSVACPLDHWWMKLEMKLLTYPLDKIQSNEEAFNYINPSIRYLKAYGKAFYGKLDRNNHVPLSIYHRALTILSSFKENNELKYQYGRLLFHGRYLQSAIVKEINLNKSKSIFKEFGKLPNILHKSLLILPNDFEVRASYFLYKYCDIFCEDMLLLKKNLYNYFKFSSEYPKILKLEFNMAQTFNGGNIKSDGNIGYLKCPPQDLKKDYYKIFSVCKNKVLSNIKSKIDANTLLIEDKPDDLFCKFKLALINGRNKKGKEIINSNLIKLHKLLIEIYRIESLLLINDQQETQAKDSVIIFYKMLEEEREKYAFKTLTLLAEQNDIFSKYLLGYFLSLKGENSNTKSFEFYKEAAEQGFYHAYATVGIMYLKGDGTKRDYQQSFKWIKKSADCNVGIAQFLLAEMYRKGQGVEPNYKEALKWCYRAINHRSCETYYYKGLPSYYIYKTFYYIGFIYERGFGVDRDLESAKHYYYKIPLPKEGRMLASIDCIPPYLVNDNFIVNRHDPFIYFFAGYGFQHSYYTPRTDANLYYYSILKLYNESDCSFSQIALGRLYKERSNLKEDNKKNLKQALHYFEIVSNEDESDGFYNLALMYRDGEGVDQNDREACGILSLAAVQMHGDALYTLGWMYEQGRGVEKDLEKANYLYCEGEKRYPADAFYSLGRMYEYGLSVPQDTEKAIKWYKKAAKLYYPEAVKKLNLF